MAAQVKIGRIMSYVWKSIYSTGIYRYLECLDKLSGCLIACLLACLLDDARLKFVLQEGGEEREKVE